MKLLEAELRGIFDPYIILTVLAYPAAELRGMRERDSSGRIFLDFNKAYNPPCAVTEFAACPMPPPENHMAVKIEAGEKVIASH